MLSDNRDILLILQKEVRMKNISGSKVRKILFLASVIVLMLALCGCRTRITNNDEVSNVMYDEEGFLQDEYSMRRDELGLGKAPKPVFTGFGAPDDDYEDYEYGNDSQALEDYDPDASEEEPYDDSEEASSSGSTSGSGAEGGSGRAIKQKTSSGNTPKTDDVEIVLDAETNGGTVSGKGTITVKLKKDGKYENLPATDARDGYTFSGWFTKREGGTNVEGKKVATDKKHKLYAQWTKVDATKTYSITLDANGGVLAEGNTLQVEEGGTYGTLPVPTSAEGSGEIFDGWYTEKEGGSHIASGDAFKVNMDQTLYAHWKKDGLVYWTKEFDLAAASVKEDKQFGYQLFSEDDQGKAEELLKECRLKRAEDYDYGIYFGTKQDAEAKKEAEGIVGKIIVVPDKAIKGSDREKLLYKILLFNKIYGGFDSDKDKAAQDLEITKYDGLEEI